MMMLEAQMMRGEDADGFEELDGVDVKKMKVEDEDEQD